MTGMNPNENLVGQLTGSIGDSLSVLNTGSTSDTMETLMMDDLKFWKETFQMQDSFNKVVYPNWKKEGFNWTRAIRGEIIECIDSFNWEWWKTKKNMPDFQNAEVELVDTFHFLISHCIVNSEDEAKVNSIATATFTLAFAKYQQLLKVSPTGVKFDQNSFIVSGEELIKFSLISPEQYQLMFIKFFDMWFLLNLTIKDLIKLYRAKNILNAFRQKNGYKIGTYVKIWGEVEDNVVCWALAKELDLDDNFANDLMVKLEESYSLWI